MSKRMINISSSISGEYNGVDKVFTLNKELEAGWYFVNIEAGNSNAACVMKIEDGESSYSMFRFGTSNYGIYKLATEGNKLYTSANIIGIKNIELTKLY